MTAESVEQLKPDLLVPGSEELEQGLSSVRQIASTIYRKLPTYVSLDDLIAAGLLGLMDAKRRFAPEAHVPFHSYAQIRIRGAILDSLRKVDPASRGLRHKSRQIEEARRRLRAQMCCEPSEADVAEQIGVSVEKLRDLLCQLDSLKPSFLQQHESLPCPTKDDPLNILLRAELKGVLLRAIGRLAETERRVIFLYYFRELTMKQIGQVLHVGESRICQLHGSAIAHLRCFLMTMDGYGVEVGQAIGSR